ncbi:hypothetical protein CPB84DRAFT_1843825 [Gymnopilus junonius]|uniref:Uncharacterized protein n=1 Tax=Gymnopilus junonius TaxID=109634 RepID=A0A9P5NXT1_GYMJU|nr:hypothetical protein CPB84DRAFT_1843825 [Gymnopilus junonius]
MTRMGHPQLYHTPEELAAANCLKSKKHYEKCVLRLMIYSLIIEDDEQNRKKGKINTRWRKIYQAERQALEKPDRQAPDPKQYIDKPMLVMKCPLALWMEVVERIAQQLGRTINLSAQEFVEKICQQYFQDCDKDWIYKNVVRLGKLQKKIYRYQNEVYELDGVGPQYERACQVVQDVCTPLKWVEELLCYAMIDFEEVRDRHVEKKFMYQVG